MSERSTHEDLPTNVLLSDVEMARLRNWLAQRRGEQMPCAYCGEALTLDRTLRYHPSYAPGPADTWALAVFSEPIATVALRCAMCGYLMMFDVEMIRRAMARSVSGQPVDE